MPLPLLALLNLSPAERLRVLQQDREELFLLMGVAVGLLVLAFLLLVVVIFRRQKSRKEELKEANLPIQAANSSEDIARFAPAEPAVSSKPESAPVKADQAKPVQEEPIEGTATEELPGEMQAEVLTETEESPEEKTAEALQAEPEIMPLEEAEVETEEQHPVEPSGEPETEKPEADPEEEAPLEEVQEAPSIELEQANTVIANAEPELEEEPLAELPESDSESLGTGEALPAQERKVEQETEPNSEVERVSKKIDEALKGAKSAEENRNAIAAYLKELEERKTGGSAALKPQVSTEETEPDSPTPSETEATQLEPVALEEKAEPEVVALLSAPKTEPDSIEVEEASSLPVDSLSEPEENTQASDFEVNWNDVQEDSTEKRHLPAAPGDLKSFADWLKEFRKP